MESLRDKIDDLRCENYYNNNFVPKDALNALLTQEAVRSALEESRIEKHRYRDIENSITGGNSRIFAILVRIGFVESMPDFIRSDQYRGRYSVDSRLPFSKEYLSNILPEKITAKFYKEQWEYAAPIFSENMIPRDLDDKTILPILHEEEVGRGGFGIVFQITLHSGHHSFNSKDNHFIRKDFPANSKSHTKESFEHELLNLSVLGNVKHPYVIGLLTAYTWKRTHSLVFPLLGKNLFKFLSEERPERFQSDASVFIALARLSLGLAHVHSFAATSVKLEKIGCHHDLKPDNILLDGDSFVLADFGLSTFKNMSEDSKTTRKVGGTNYSAPECEDIADSRFKKGRAGRKSDIWAFGCIIAELLTYILLGPTGVSDFREKRVFIIQGFWKLASFHCGSGPNPAVDAWLSKLETSPKKSRRALIQLIRRMLQLDPDCRPDADSVANILQTVALQERCYPIDALFDALWDTIRDKEERDTLFVEYAGYQSWKETCGLTEEGKQTPFDDLGGLNFDVCVEILSQYQATVEEILHRLPETDHAHLFVPLRHANGRLQQLLPSKMREESQRRLAQNTVVAVEDRDRLGHTKKALESGPYGLSASKLANVKLMTKAVEENWSTCKDGPRLDVEMAAVHLEQRVEHHHVGRIGTGMRHVWIEWLCHGTHVLPETEATQRAQRVQAVARLLKDMPHPPGFRLLRCSHFFHDSANSRFGLAFDFPSTSSSVTTLSEWLRHSSDDRTVRPPLGDRFRLAYALASTIAEFHRVGWLHRNISPHNVVFFPSGGAPGEPYVVGFSHSRPNKPNEFTQGPGQAHEDYQHPQYAGKKRRYRVEFDYYSLGVVLLEIALWKLLSEFAGSPEWKTLNPTDFRLALIKQAQSGNLAHSMGTRYSQAMKACLSGCTTQIQGQPEGFGKPDGDIQLQQAFQNLVVDELAKCSA